MVRRGSALTPDHLARLPGRCAGCLVWERFADGAPLAAAARRDLRDDPTAVKRRWWVQAQSAGSAGGLVVRGPGVHSSVHAGSNGGRDGAGHGGTNGTGTAPSDVVAAYVTYAVPARSGGDALTVLGLHVDVSCRGVGLGRALVQGVAREALRRPRVRAVEALAGRWGAVAGSDGGGFGPPCLVPLDFWLACGFTVVREHPLTPRVRLDARVLAAWRTELEEAVEQAWSRLRGAVRPEPVPGPALSGSQQRSSTPAR